MSELDILDQADTFAQIRLHKNNESTIALKRDNQSAIALVNNSMLHSRIKHIDIQHHYIKDEVTVDRIELFYVLTENMIADELTKSLTHVKFFTFIRQTNMKISRINQKLN